MSSNAADPLQTPQQGSLETLSSKKSELVSGTADRLVAVMPIEHGDGRCAWRLWVKVNAAVPTGSAHALDIAPDTEDTDGKVALATWLKANGQTGKRVVMLLDASDCFAVPTPIADLARKGRDQAMVYRVEESLPLDAEDLAVGFLGQGAERLAIAVMAKHLEPQLRVIEAATLTVSAIVPEALVAAEAIGIEGEVSAGTLLCLSENKEFACDLVDYHDKAGRPDARYRSWFHFKSLVRLRMYLQTNAPGSIYLFGDESADDVLPDNTAVVRNAEWNRVQAVANQCQAIADRRADPPIDLIQTPCSLLRPADWTSRLQRPLQALAVAALLFFASVVATGLIGLHQAQQEIDQYEYQLRQAFMDAHPGQSVPASLLSRLRSEARRVQGIHRADTSPFSIGDSIAAVSDVDTVYLLAQVAESLPPDLRFRIGDLRVDSRRVYLSGQARSHTEAQRIGDALGALPGLTPGPPRTELQQDAGAFPRVYFTLQAEVEQIRKPSASAETEQAAVSKQSLRPGAQVHAHQIALGAAQ